MNFVKLNWKASFTIVIRAFPGWDDDFGKIFKLEELRSDQKRLTIRYLSAWYRYTLFRMQFIHFNNDRVKNDQCHVKRRQGVVKSSVDRNSRHFH